MTNIEITKAYVGSTEVSKLYLGVNQIYPSGPTPPPVPDYSKMPLTFEMLSAGTIVWEKVGAPSSGDVIQYKINDDNRWYSITAVTGTGAEIQVQAGDKVQFRGETNPLRYEPVPSYADNSTNYHTIKSSAPHIIYGNMMSMIGGYSYIGIQTLYSAFTFSSFFRANTGCEAAGNLVLPATTLAQSCYWDMFYGCTSLTTAPELPATTLTVGCYGFMFRDCTSLTTAPELLAPTPLTGYSSGSYIRMFEGCTNLNYIKCLATSIGVGSSSRATNRWVDGVQTNSGTFIKDPNMTGWPTGINGIPENWTVIDAS